MDERETEQDLEDVRRELGDGRLWLASFIAAALIGLGGIFIACATGNTLPPLAPVPDISGPPLMQHADGGAGCTWVGAVLTDAGTYRSAVVPCSELACACDTSGPVDGGGWQYSVTGCPCSARVGAPR